MNVISQINDSVSQYRSRIKKKKAFFNYARSTTTEEIILNYNRIKVAKNKKELFRSLLKLTNSSVWIGRSGISYLKTYFDLRLVENKNHGKSRSQEIIASVVNSRTIEARDDEVFKTIYDEIAHTHLHSSYQCPLSIPRIDMTIVLVSGVFNEVFSTPAFKRGAEILLDEYHIKHIAPKVDGTKGAKVNALKLKTQIDSYIENHPNEKLWFFCFSKGGIDTLHFLKGEGDNVHPNIAGISFIATPIMGTDHINHRGVKFVNLLAKIPEAATKKLMGKEIDPILKELQNSLAKTYRENWFKKNHKLLPKNIFYTALAFESKWHTSHVYMMLTKAMLKSGKANDGIVDVENAQFPTFFNGMNLGVLDGHHLVGTRSSFYDQEALMKAHLIFLRYKKQI